MAFDWTSFIGENVGDTIAKVIGAFKVDPTIALEKSTELSEMKLQLTAKLIDQITAQSHVNEVEAANKNMFVAGWRPFIGWICGSGLAIQFIVNPIVTWIAALAGHPVQFPSLDLGTLLTLLGGMLGLGAMRTYEKVSSAPGANGLN